MEEQVVAVAAPEAAVAPEPAPVVASFLQAAGASAAEWTALVGVIGEVNRPPDLAYISAPEFDKALEEVKLGGRALPLTVKARLRGVKQAVTDHLQSKANPKSMPVPTSQMGHKCKLSAVLDQAAEGEVMRLDTKATTDLYAAYAAKRGGYPHQDHDPSVDQISAYHQGIQDGSLPYADFSIFGPHGDRLTK
eukprot:3355578-Amphidinium_carterae.1